MSSAYHRPGFLRDCGWVGRVCSVSFDVFSNEPKRSLQFSLYVISIHSTFGRLYFSAHWCPPCRKFTPLLADAYNAHKEFISTGDDHNDVGEIEVIFISLDSVQSQYDQYRNTMPWLSVPFSNLHKLRIKDELSGKYGVKGIPDLIVLDGNSGEVVSRNGRGEYASYFKGEYKTGSSLGCIVS